MYGNGRERRVNQSVVILGSTGSVGNSALDVIRANRSRYRVVGLAANDNLDALSAQCAEFSPHTAVLANEMRAEQLAAQLASQVSTNQVTSQAATNQVSTNQAATKASRKVDASNDSSTRVEGGDAAVCRLASSGADIVICAIVGAAGLPSTWAAVQRGNKVLIANKEPLVMLGRALIDEARAHNSVVIPLDSEHNAIFQCLPARAQAAKFDSLGDCGVPAHLVDRIGRAIARINLVADGAGDAATSLRASELVDGAQNLGRLGDDDEQRLGINRSLRIVWLKRR